MSEMMGRKTARAITAERVSSKNAMTLAAITFSTMLMLSQDSRLPERCRSGIVRSSSPPTMPCDLR